MSTRASLRLRSKRKVKVNLPLTEQDLQEYLDDGYTPARIAKEYGVSLTVISERIQKFRTKGRTKQRKAVKKRGRQVPPKKQKPRGRPVNRRSSPRKTKDDNKEQEETPKQDLNSVITQVMQDNPKEADNIHALLDFMGFSVEKSFVEDHLERWKAAGGVSPKKGQTPSKLDGVAEKGGESSQEMKRGTPENEDDTSQASTSEVDKGTAAQPAEDGFLEKQTAEEKSVSDDIKVTDISQEGDVTSEVKEGDHAAGGSVDEDETFKPELVKRRGGRRSRKTCKIEPLQVKPVKRPKRRRARKADKKDEDATTGDSGEDNAVEDNISDKDWSEDKESNTIPRKRGRKRGRRTKTETKEVESGTGKGRPRLNLTKENLQHCIDSGLTTAQIAEVFGAGVQSVKRYLRMHKMRKKDRVSKISNEELDQIVMEMCKEHPEWGQVHIQEELKRKGFFLCRAQVRSSVRRVDPVGIEVRRLKNLKMRWNRGSMNKLDKILPADGISMTSTESFISKPPRNGLNALNDEESVRILTSVVASSKKTYVEAMSREILERSKLPEDKDGTLDNKGEPSVAEEDQEKKFEGELVVASLKVENASEMMTGETGNKENIETDSNKQPDPRASSFQMSDKEDEENYRQRFYNMIMSYEKCRRESAPETNESVVNIPKEELAECVNLGFSTARMAEKFGTSRSNVIRHLNMYKVGKPRRFDDLSDETLDQIVMDVINEFSIRKGSDVYSYAKKKGFQIRRVDINKSLARLFPKGLHRKSSSILQESWDAASKSHPSDIECATTQGQEQGVEIGNGGETIVMECTSTQGQVVETLNVGETVVMECTTSQGQVQTMQTANGGETVVVLNSEELAQLIHGDGNIVIEYESGEQVPEHAAAQQIVSEFGENQVGQDNSTQQQSQVFVLADETQGVEQCDQGNIVNTVSTFRGEDGISADSSVCQQP